MAILLECLLAGSSREIQRRFAGDPAGWLPGTITEHGAHEFRTELRIAGITLPLVFHIGTPWVQGDTSSRRLHIDLPRHIGGLLPHTLTGDLVIEHRADVGSSLRFTPAFVSRRDSAGLRVPGLTRRLGRAVANRVHHDIAGRLSERPMGDAPT